VPLEVTVEIGAKPYFRNVDVLTAATAALQNLFSFDNADFGQTLYLSKVYEAVETLDGVEFVVVDNFRIKPVPPATSPSIEPTGRIVLHDDEIPVLASADLSVSVTGGVSGASA
jgi:hypothetical protein